MTRQEFEELLPKQIGEHIFQHDIESNEHHIIVTTTIPELELNVCKLGVAVDAYPNPYNRLIQMYIEDGLRLAADIVFKRTLLDRIYATNGRGPIMANYDTLWTPTKVPDKLAERPITPDDAIKTPKLPPRRRMDEIVRPTKPRDFDNQQNSNL